MREMSREEAIEFLMAGTRAGKLATASPSGAPSVAPLWFTVDGDDVVFSTGCDSLKGRHLTANPRAALTVDSDEFPYAYVTVRGPVTVTEDPDDSLEWNTRLAERYVPKNRAEEYGRRNSSPGMMVCPAASAAYLGVGRDRRLTPSARGYMPQTAVLDEDGRASVAVNIDLFAGIHVKILALQGRRDHCAGWAYLATS